MRGVLPHILRLINRKVIMLRWAHIFILGLAPVVGGCSPACSSTSLAQIHDPAGVTFTVTRTDCDVIAKDSAISVIASRDGEKGSTLLLKYDPWENEVPQVHVGDGGVIFIHLLRASSVLEQHLAWGQFKVSIAIDKLAYPDGGRTT
jgi:hypothetical protein